MNNYNNNYTQKRESEANSKRFRKENATSAHLKEVKDAISGLANDIASRYGLSESSYKKIVSLLYWDKEIASELPIRINFIINTLKKYGYNEKKAASIIDSNFSLLKQDSLGLVHTLAIANQYGFDEEYLINNKFYSNIKEKEMYSIIEELKANGIEISLDNVSALYKEVKKDGNLYKLNELYPLKRSTILTYRTLYDRNMNQIQKVKVK